MSERVVLDQQNCVFVGEHKQDGALLSVLPGQIVEFVLLFGLQGHELLLLLQNFLLGVQLPHPNVITTHQNE